MANPESGAPPAFHVMTKPIGPVCNLDCTYCFYLEKEKLYPDRSNWRMTEEVLEQYVRQYIAAQKVPEVTFAWQGGEPTLMGVDFFRKVVELQAKYADGKVIHNALQTNATQLRGEWGPFLAEHGFLVGVSIDGPEEIHNRYRVDKGGHGSWKRVMRGIEHLKEHGVEFNTLTVVQRHNAKHPLAVYRFLKEVGSGFMQFIPIVERFDETAGEHDLTLVSPSAGEEPRVSEWSVRPIDYGRFLSGVFDEWVRQDVGRYFVQIFDIALEAWLGYNPSLCVFRETCGDGMALEHNGDLYSCDHYVYPENRLGNILEESIEALAGTEQQRKFGTDKRDALPRYCRDCEVYFVCHGECPKHRFTRTPDGEPGLNYLCAGYKHFFRHIDPHMRFMANELRAGRPPANVMEYIRVNEARARAQAQAPGAARTKPNDPCPCGSGRKFKKCCGRTA